MIQKLNDEKLILVAQIQHSDAELMSLKSELQEFVSLVNILKSNIITDNI